MYKIVAVNDVKYLYNTVSAFFEHLEDAVKHVDAGTSIDLLDYSLAELPVLDLDFATRLAVDLQISLYEVRGLLRAFDEPLITGLTEQELRARVNFFRKIYISEFIGYCILHLRISLLDKLKDPGVTIDHFELMEKAVLFIEASNNFLGGNSPFKEVFVGFLMDGSLYMRRKGHVLEGQDYEALFLVFQGLVQLKGTSLESGQDSSLNCVDLQMSPFLKAISSVSVCGDTYFVKWTEQDFAHHLEFTMAPSWF